MLRKKTGAQTYLSGDNRLAERGVMPAPESRTIELPEEVWSWVDTDADRHGRTLAEELAWIIREHCAARRQRIPLAERWGPGRQ